jgi:hypothetical protein
MLPNLVHINAALLHLVGAECDESFNPIDVINALADIEDDITMALDILETEKSMNQPIMVAFTAAMRLVDYTCALMSLREIVRLTINDMKHNQEMAVMYDRTR